MKKNYISFSLSSVMTSISGMFIVLVAVCLINLNAYADKGNEPLNSNKNNESIPLQTPPLTVDLTPHVYSNGFNISCFGFKDGSITLVVNGGVAPYKFAWSTGDSTQNLSDLPSGFYMVSVTDAEGHGIRSEITLNQPEPLTKLKVDYALYEYPNGYNVSCTGCYNGIADVIVTGGSGTYIYKWRDGATTAHRTGLGAQEYSVNIEDGDACSQGENVNLSIKLTEPPKNDWNMNGNAGTDPNSHFIGTTDNTDFVFRSNNIERLRLKSNGNIGFGTNNPTEKLHVVGNGIVTGGFNINGNVGIGTLTPTEKLTISGNAKISDNLFVDKKIRVQGSLKIDSLGGEGFKLDSLSDNSYKVLMVDKHGMITTLMPYNNVGSPSPMQISYAKCAYIPRMWTINGDDIGGDLPTRLGTCNNKPLILMANQHESIVINDDGNVGIGTFTPRKQFEVVGDATFSNKVGIGTVNVPEGCLLGVKGSVYAQEYVCTLTGWPTWPDFVFDKKYELLPLNELEKYITTEKHLPNIPSATQVENDGIKLGEMNALLLQKIEELTLYMIELNKANQALKQEVETLKEVIKSN